MEERLMIFFLQTLQKNVSDHKKMSLVISHKNVRIVRQNY